MERMTVEHRDGQFVGVVQSLRDSTWRTVVVLPETAHDALPAAIQATAPLASQIACPFVSPAPMGLERAA